MIVTVVVDNRLRVLCNDLDEQVVAELKQAFEHSNPQFYKLQRLELPTYTEKRIIKTWESESHYDDRWLSLPRGGTKRLNEIFERHGIEADYQDARTFAEPAELPHHNVNLFPHQESLVQTAIDLEQCILKAPTASGKTTCAFALAVRVRVPTIVIVSSRALFDQWIARAQKELGLKKKDIGVIQGKNRSLKPLTIAMQKTLAEHGVDEEMNAYFGAVICDEVHLFAARTFLAAVNPFRARYRIGISADHTRKDRKEFLLYDVFGGVGAEIKRADLIKSGHILDVEIRVIPSDFQADWYGMPEDEPPEDFADVVGDEKDEPEDKALDFDRLLIEMADSKERNALIIQAVEYEIESEQVLVMSHRREHCRLLDQLLVYRDHKTGFLIGGEDYRKEFVATRESFEKGKLRCAIGTFQAIGYGIDLPKAAVCVAATPIAGNKQFFNQVRGRICRTAKGKKSARMYYIFDRHVYGVKHLKNLVRWNGADRVKVLDPAGKWIDAKTYMLALRNAA